FEDISFNSYLPNLAKLYLTNNLITSISQHSFRALDNLRYINLNANNISFVHMKSFEGLKKLSYLILSDNPIEIFDGVSTTSSNLNCCSYLTALSLSGNLISDIPQFIFDKLSKLETLELNFNKLKIIREGSFRGLHNLKSLYMSNNDIYAIENNAFVDLPSLGTLNLANSFIDHVLLHEKRLNLEKLIMTDSNLETISGQSVRSLERIKSVQLTSDS
ncbi:hypothetical protein HELRODRAFT_82466, partial [Helobdella robusta]|uniref:Uncharacterized protein n=1 Tax=Helobdella robusta TaxID=6412 RepID=T1G4S6_HELRO